MTYPWKKGDKLTAEDLNTAFGAATAGVNIPALPDLPVGAPGTTDYLPVAHAGATYRMPFINTQPSVNVRLMGADPTGTISSLAAFQAAFATGRNVVADGVYKLDGTVAFTADRQWLIGEGCQIVGSGEADLFSLGGGLKSCGISGAYFNAAGMTGGHLFNIRNAAKFTAENVLADNAWNGVYIEQTNVATFRSVRFGNIRGSYGLKWYGSASLRSDVLQLAGVGMSSINAHADGIIWDGNCNTLEAQNVNLVQMGYGLRVLNSSGGPVPMFGLFGIFQVDFPQQHAVSLEAGQHFIFSPTLYLHGSANGSGVYVGSAIGADQVHISGGKITGHARYGVENTPRVKLGNPYYSGNTLGDVLGPSMVSSAKFQTDNNNYIALQSGDPILNWDANDFRKFTRSTNTDSLQINGVVVETATDAQKAINVPMKLAGYSFASLPAAAANNGNTVRISDRNNRLATSDGTTWRWAGDGTAVS